LMDEKGIISDKNILAAIESHVDAFLKY
jgi:hypothetical protein